MQWLNECKIGTCCTCRGRGWDSPFFPRDSHYDTLWDTFVRHCAEPVQISSCCCCGVAISYTQQSQLTDWADFLQQTREAKQVKQKQSAVKWAVKVVYSKAWYVRDAKFLVHIHTHITQESLLMVLKEKIKEKKKYSFSHYATILRARSSLFIIIFIGR